MTPNTDGPREHSVVTHLNLPPLGLKRMPGTGTYAARAGNRIATQRTGSVLEVLTQAWFVLR